MGWLMPPMPLVRGSNQSHSRVDLDQDENMGSGTSLSGIGNAMSDDVRVTSGSMAWPRLPHYIDAIMTTMASQITSLTVVYSIVYSGADQRKHQSSASLAFVRGIHRDR